MMTDIFIFLFFDVALTDMTFFFSYTASYAFLSTRSFSIVLSVLFLKVFCKKVWVCHFYPHGSFQTGIGGFMVRQRNKAGQAKAKPNLTRKDSTGSLSEIPQGKDESENLSFSFESQS